MDRRTVSLLIVVPLLASVIIAGAWLARDARADDGPSSPSTGSTRTPTTEHVPTIGVEFPTTCDGRDVTVVVPGDGKLVHGTKGDDVVAVADGSRYEPGGGTDVVCGPNGKVEAVLRPENEAS